jgi:hypothetical protein
MEEQVQEQETKKDKGFSKLIVAIVIILNVIFTIVVLGIVALGIPEPSTLIISWFSFTTVELLALAGIRKAELNNNPFNPFNPNPHLHDIIYSDKGEDK